MTTEQQARVIKLKEECNTFYEQISGKINDLCNSLDFRDASKLSHIADKLDLFIKGLNGF